MRITQGGCQGCSVTNRSGPHGHGRSRSYDNPLNSADSRVNKTGSGTYYERKTHCTRDRKRSSKQNWATSRYLRQTERRSRSERPGNTKTWRTLIVQRTHGEGGGEGERINTCWGPCPVKRSIKGWYGAVKQGAQCSTKHKTVR